MKGLLSSAILVLLAGCGREPMSDPTVLALTDLPDELLVTRETVYWRQRSGSLGAVSTTGGATRTFGQPSSTELCSGVLTEGARAIWWSDCKGALWRVSVDGGEASIAERGPVTAVAVGGNHLYWVAGDTRRVMRREIDQSTASLVSKSQIVIGFRTLAIDEIRAYWGATLPWSPDGSRDQTGIWAAPVEGGAPFQVAYSQASIGEITVDPTFVYWVDHNNDLSRSPLAGGIATFLRHEPHAIKQLRVLDGRVHFIESSAMPRAIIRSIATDGTDPQTHYETACYLSGLALDDRSFYFMECSYEDQWRVRKIPRKHAQ